MPTLVALSLDEAVVQFGVAGIAIGVLLWFLRALVTHGVVPFVQGTLANQQRIAEAIVGVESSTRETARVMVELTGRLDRHMTKDEAIDELILAQLKKKP